MNAYNNQQALGVLVGLSLSSFGRASNMLWLSFGELKVMSVKGGGTKLVGQWAIHVQCSWRLSRLGQIAVASRDFYYTPEGNFLVDWDAFLNKSRFDQMAKIICTGAETDPSIVTSVDCDDADGFSIHFDDNGRLDVFPDLSVSGEHWRLFQPGVSKKHFVVGLS